jgi:hypothetical protein
MPRRRGPESIRPDLSPEKAYSALSTQLESLRTLKGRDYKEARADEREWENLTEKLIIRAFGSDSANARNFYHARAAGVHQITPFGGGVPHARNQNNFEARIQAYESLLKSCLTELKLNLPDAEIRGVYEPGQEYEFYSDVKFVLGLATKEVFIIDPYISPEMFELYANAISRTISFRLLTANVPPVVQALAQKYATGGNLQFRSTNAIHDRVVFSDNRVWLCGQSLKDAAKKKPTYIVEHDEPLVRPAYEEIWGSAKPAI